MLFRKKYENKTVKKPVVKRVKVDKKWILIVTILAFAIELVLSLFSELTVNNFGLIIGLIFLLVFIIIAIIADIVGVAIMVADVEQFHSMAAKKMRGAKLAIKLVAKKEHVNNFCSDVIGDVCGILIGSATLAVAMVISEYGYDRLLSVVLLSSIVATLVITGKAIGKAYAANLSNFIIYETAKILSYIYRVV